MRLNVFVNFFYKNFYFNPRIPLGMRHVAGGGSYYKKCVFQSTHPIRDATLRRFSWSYFRVRFQSTHPIRDATLMGLVDLKDGLIFQSTHPIRDATWCSNRLSELYLYFNPRIPLGMRQAGTGHTFEELIFQSTHPIRDATQLHHWWFKVRRISIHASH